MGQPGFTEQNSLSPHRASEVFTIRPCCGSASELGWGGAPGRCGCSGFAPLCRITAITCLAHMWFCTNSLTDSHDTGRGRTLGFIWNDVRKEIAAPWLSFFFSVCVCLHVYLTLDFRVELCYVEKRTRTAQSLRIGTGPNQWARNSRTRTFNHTAVPLTSFWFLTVTRSGLTVILLAVLDVK